MDLRNLTQEEDLTKEQKEAAWDKLYYCVHWGAEDARPIEMDQRQLIMLVHYLTNK